MTLEHRIRPAVLLALDPAAAELTAEVTLELARLHPPALPFFAATVLPPDLDAGEQSRRIRTAFEAVTDLGARQAAMLAGGQVEDALHVFIALLLAAVEEPRLETLLEAIHRTGTDFFHQTPLTVHLLLFLPDLAPGEERARRYATAYRQISEIDELGTPDHALGFRTHSSIDYRWLIDCRTRTGAHAGGMASVRQPVSSMISILLAGTSGDPYLAGEKTARRLRAVQDGRVAGYSALGTATIFHEPEMVLRYLCMQAAEGLLAPHLAENPGEADLEADAAAWADEVQLLREATFGLSDQRERGKAQARLAGALEGQIVGWLADGGVPRAQATLELLTSGPDDIHGTVACYSREHQDALRDFLRLDALESRIEELAEEEARIWSELERITEPREDVVSTDANYGEMTTDSIEEKYTEIVARREELSQKLEQRKALLDPDSTPEMLEAALIEKEEPQPAFWFPSDVPQSLDVPESPLDSSSPRSIEPEPERGWFGGLHARLFQTSYEDPAPASLPPAVELPPPPPETPPPGSSPGALAEDRRWLGRYAALLQEALSALESHEADVAAAAEYFTAQGEALQRYLTQSTPFRIPALTPGDLEGYRTRLGPGMSSALEERYGRERIARCYRLEPGELAEGKTRWLERLPDLDEAIREAGEAAAGNLRSETLADLLSGAGTLPSPRPLAAWLRALLECSEPLLRPEGAHSTGGAASLHRWLIADARTLGLLEEDTACSALLAAAQDDLSRVESADPRFLTLASALHGFPGHSLRKLIPFRQGLRLADVVYPSHEPLSPRANLAGAGGRVYELVVLAATLGCLPANNGGYQIDSQLIPGDFRDVAEALCFTPALRPAHRALRAEVEAALSAPDALDRLRSVYQSASWDIAREILLSTIAELESQRFLGWEEAGVEKDHG